MNKLLAIVGPTGVGKTEFAVKLAKNINAEIVSADSRQVYKGMDIGTAKPTPEQLNQVPYHLIDIINPDDGFSLSTYQTLAYDKIQEIIDRGKNPILVGGTGLYIRAIIDGMNIPKVVPNKLLRHELEGLPTDDLVSRLSRVDQASANKIPTQNRRRIIRAIEVSETLGQPFSVLTSQHSRRFDTLQIGLTSSRDELYQRADERVNRWLSSGWVDEVKKLREAFPENLPAMSGLGYRQLGMVLDDKINLPEAVKRIKFETHGYIRRQLTWFRADGRISWYDINNSEWETEVAKEIDSWYSERSNETS